MNKKGYKVKFNILLPSFSSPDSLCSQILSIYPNKLLNDHKAKLSPTWKQDFATFQYVLRKKTEQHRRIWVMRNKLV